jgi:hypothetical protein
LISVNCECDLSPSVLDPVGRNALCLPCPQCVRAEELPAGKALEFGWTPGPDHCGEEMLPGRYRVTWGGFSNEGETHFGETGVLVLPPLDRRLELSPSQNDVRPGDLLEITVTNPLAVPVWYRGCCDEVIFIDVLGRESLAYPCGDDCMVSRRQEIPPGASLRLEVSVPGSAPGRLSVLWGRSLGLEPGSKPTPPVFGYAEVTVLPDAAPPFRRGDCDGAGGLDVTDAVRLLEYLFLGGAAPKCPDACDADDSGELELTDAVWTLAFLFLGGPNPLPPFPAPGPDPTPDLLGCKG